MGRGTWSLALRAGLSGVFVPRVSRRDERPNVGIPPLSDRLPAAGGFAACVPRKAPPSPGATIVSRERTALTLDSAQSDCCAVLRDRFFGCSPRNWLVNKDVGEEERVSRIPMAGVTGSQLELALVVPTQIAAFTRFGPRLSFSPATATALR